MPEKPAKIPVSVRPATPNDAATIALFNLRLAYESEGIKLNSMHIKEGVQAVLADANKGRYFLAEADGVVAGQLLVTYEWSDWRNGWVWWLQSVYVRRDLRRKGVFRALLEHVSRVAADEHATGIRLYVEEANDAATSTYRALGFNLSSYRVMVRPSNVQ
ncbi:MAG: GNAT family N-acetyltransferase [Phycisphaerae bacterium]